ncbi:MAG: hypothetical protein KDI37_01480 [Xanthomonadales bacterium]|nr:hypothetical protein [Xanthomonadales bacterium]MCB1640371.1 hypothetical protein [Xanthomonadales bacterium]
MAAGTTTDARRAFDAIATHLSSKRMELRVAIEHGRGIEGWLQHEAIVALDNAYWGDLAGRLYSFGREGLRHKDSSTYDEASKRRPFDLVFEDPEMVGCLKIYMPWKTLTEAIRDVRKDLIELREHPNHGFLIAGRLDFDDTKTTQGRERKRSGGGDWLKDVVRGAQDGMRLKSLASSSSDSDAEFIHMEIPPMRWDWPDGAGGWTEGYREPFLALGGWSVWRPTTG